MAVAAPALAVTNRRNRHCERSEAIQTGFAELDCFVASLLAMTKKDEGNTPSVTGPS
jgi:hypothetical protein